MRPIVMVHGGAGQWSDERLPSGIEGCRAAAVAGAEKLGVSALAAAVSAVHVLEQDPNFNAGFGATLTRDGTIELDAAIMTGDLRFGAVGGCPPVASAIQLAKAVYEDGEHTLLVGEGALRFAREMGMEALGPDDLITDAAREAFERERQRREHGAATLGSGTVGAVAVDEAGRLASATSTGGVLYKKVGRIGDTPLPGAGTYADDRAGGASSATGLGEKIMAVLMCREAVQALGEGLNVQQAVGRSIAVLEDRVGGRAGIILVDRSGNAFADRNTKAMPWASCGLDQRPESGS